ncbi:hypothetical protein [Microbacterium gorillae]|uniref:hypothetical protein n=1 Tax=Microbacterium gorillae TaxID=1231063 RepID=UPI003D954F43
MTAHLVEVMLRPTGQLYVQVLSASANRIWSVDGLPTVLDSGTSSIDLGAAVLGALEKSTFGLVEDPTPFDLPSQSPLLAWAGVKTWSTYNRDCRIIQVRADYDHGSPTTVILTPQARDRTGGYSPLSGLRKRDVDATDPAELGTAILLSLQDATA